MVNKASLRKREKIKGKPKPTKTSKVRNERSHEVGDRNWTHQIHTKWLVHLVMNASMCSSQIADNYKGMYEAAKLTCFIWSLTVSTSNLSKY